MHPCQVRVGHVVAQGLSLYQKAFIPLLVLSGIAQAGNGALSLLVYSPKALGGGFYWLLSAVASVAYLPLWTWISLATLFTIDRVEHGERPSAGDIVGSPRGKFWRFLGASVRAIALVLGATVATAAVALLPTLGLGIVAFMTRLKILFVGAMALALLGLLVAIGVEVWVLVRVALYGVLVALEPKVPQGPGPIRRSWRLMRTHVWRGLGIWLIASLWCIPAGALSFLAFDPQSMQIRSVALYLTSLVVGALAMPVLSTTAVALYRAVKAKELS
jgi:hypothetical protein